ncbi:hypothetical protein BS50DRAFT_605391 [Corynespora cassiicola Philippines]|uniref:NAD(P)-binding protein n=1 Tax=Corynespora cassiicola Philippines TaxID=1448308 RepID=A0A2T2N101_CORCC|nr:hypothetical protein BS50DRAFT_605391 [Corynespora cassiicola Philippines]
MKVVVVDSSTRPKTNSENHLESASLLYEYETKNSVPICSILRVGAAVACQLAAKKCNLILVCTSNASMLSTQQLYEQLSSSYGIDCVSVQTYNTQGNFQVDILVNNAGISSNQPLNDEKRGSIESAGFDGSSVSYCIGYQGQSIYAESKAAAKAIMRVWSQGLAQHATPRGHARKGRQGIGDTNQPYVDATPLIASEGDADFVAVSMKGLRPGFTGEMARIVDISCSQESSWTMDSVICANGGMKMSFA